MVCFLDEAYRILKKKWAEQNCGHLEDEIIEMAAILVRNSIRTTVYEIVVVPTTIISESFVTPALPAPLQRFI